MKKYILSLGLISGFFIYALLLRNHNSEHVVSAGTQPVSTLTPTNNSSAASTPATTSSSNTTPTNASSTSTTSSTYKDGTYTGPSVNAYYGNVQVQVKIAGGRITDVSFLDYPHDRSTSQFINSQAMPILKQEVIQAQNANINGASGASLTSSAFVQSLSSALQQATS